MSRTWDALRKAEAERTQQLHPVDHPRPIGVAAVSPAAPDGAHLEYERVRVWLHHPGSPQERLRSLMVVASHSGAGGTTTAALLATTLAESRALRVLIVESNWRTPRLGKVFRIPNGHAAYAVDAAALESRISPSDRPNLFVLPAPNGTENPQRPYEDETLDEVLDTAKQQYDLVILDAPPIDAFPDSLTMAPKVDGVILVTESEKTRIEDARRAKHDLERAGGRIVGVVINRHTDYVPRFVRRALGSR